MLLKSVKSKKISLSIFAALFAVGIVILPSANDFRALANDDAQTEAAADEAKTLLDNDTTEGSDAEGSVSDDDSANTPRKIDADASVSPDQFDTPNTPENAADAAKDAEGDFPIIITDAAGDGELSATYTLHIPKTYNGVKVEGVKVEFNSDVRNSAAKYAVGQTESLVEVQILKANGAVIFASVKAELSVTNDRDSRIDQTAKACILSSDWMDACWYSNDTIVRKQYFREGETRGTWANRTFFYNPFEYASIVYKIDDVQVELSGLSFMSTVDPGAGDVTGEYVNLWH